MNTLVSVTAASHPFWSSTLALVLVAAVCAIAVGLVVVLLLLQRSSPGVRDRVGAFVSPSGPASGSEHGSESHSGRFLAVTERLLEREQWWEAFEQRVELAGIERPAIEVVYLTVIGTLACAVLMAVIASSVLVALAILVAGPLLARAVINHRLLRQRNLFSDQLAAHLQEMSAAIRAGHSLVSAIGVMAESASEPTRREFRRVVADEQLGLPLEDSLRSVAARMQARDVEQVALVAELHHRTGGNMAEVLDRVADGVRDRAELNGELRALTAQARMSRSIVTAIPLILVGVIFLIDSTYLDPLLHTTFGNVLLALGACMVVAGWLVMGRIATVEV